MIAGLTWWLAIQLCGLLALPLAWRLCARLPGRGYPQAKALGLLLASYILWLGASFHILPNDLGGILVALLALAGLSLWLGRTSLRAGPEGEGAPLLAWLRDHWRLVLATELLFAVTFAAWGFFRAHSADISATEKPMEFAFINGVLGSRFFPPHDPWLSGYAISYYYFGYVMLALLIRLAGVAPEIGFNLGVASWYALLLVGAFGVVYDLVCLADTSRGAGEQGRDGQNSPAPWLRRSPARGIGWGLVGALFAGVIGNLEGVIEVGYNLRLLPEGFLRWLDINGLFAQAPTGNPGGGWWWQTWWRASRVINDKDLLGHHVEVIDEFPSFSFILGDMHPHVLALPFVLFAVTLALNLLLAARDWRLEIGDRRLGAQDSEGEPRERVASPAALSIRAGALSEANLQSLISNLVSRVAGPSLITNLGSATGLGLPGIGLYAVALGSLAFLNTWDFPIYLGLAVLALGAGLAQAEGLTRGVAARTVGAGLVFGALGWLAYLPFYVGFQSQAGGILPNLLFPTRLSQFFLMFGLFLVIVVFFLVQLTRELRGARVGRRALSVLPWPLLLPLALIGGILLLALVLPQGRALIDGLLNDPAIQSRLPVAEVGPLLGLIAQVRLATPWTYLLLAGLIAWAVAVLWVGIRDWRLEIGDSPRGERSPNLQSPISNLHSTDIFAVLMIALALLLVFSVEFVYLKDNFGSRMNTVFKFYYQAWILLALASAYGLSRLASRKAPVSLQTPALLLAILLGAGSLIYPMFAAPSKAEDFRNPATLDGLAYLRQYNPGDYAAIEWIRENVPPAALVLEASYVGTSYSPEGAGRVSMSTGNPTLLGWDGHEQQWRGKAYDKLAAGRLQAIDQIYRSARAEELPALLDQWHVDYVYVGDLERRKFGITDATLARFDRAGLQLVYNAGGVRIYAR